MEDNKFEVKYLSVRRIRRVDSEYDVVVARADRAVPPGHCLAHVDRLPGHHELVQHVEAPLAAVLDHQFLLKWKIIHGIMTYVYFVYHILNHRRLRRNFATEALKVILTAFIF